MKKRRIMLSKYVVNCLYNGNHDRKEGFIGGSDNMRSIDGKNVAVVYVCRHNVNGMVDFFGYLIKREWCHK